MYPPDVIQFNLACMTVQTEDADALRAIAKKLLAKYADDPVITNGIERNVEILEYREGHDIKNDSRPGHRILTPRLLGTEERPTLYVSDEDRDKVTRGPGYKGIVTDVDTGKRYKVFGAPCGAPNCYCDATAEEVA